MSNVGNILLDNEILLESGTNELEILVFHVADYMLGINVAKVREVLPACEITALPNSHKSVRGVFSLRDKVVPVVSLIDHLELPASDNSDTESTLVLADFNNQQTAFLVDRIEQIYRMNWKDILMVPSLMSLANTPITGVARNKGRLIIMLDFEMVIDQVTDHLMRVEAIENPHQLPREQLQILVAEDSHTAREAVRETLTSSGYTNLKIFENGALTWQWIEKRFQETADISKVADLLISDVEMPQMDGFHLTRRIKEHPELRKLPVLLYSSIITPDNHKKGIAVGADKQIAKPDLHKIVSIADELIAHSNNRLPTTTSDLTPKTTTVDSHQSPTASESKTQTNKTEENIDHHNNSGEYSNLWITFLDELRGLLSQIEPLFKKAATQSLTEEEYRDLARRLHTIKSASSVVPIPPVVQATHQVETLTGAVGNGSIQWPTVEMTSYFVWLEEISQASDQAPKVAENSQDLVVQLVRAAKESSVEKSL